MSTVASSSKPSRSTLNNDFRPRYPLDPFNNAPIFSSGSRIPQTTVTPAIDLHDPWLLKIEHLPPSQALRRDVILVLGIPKDNSMEHFMSSSALSNSLLIVACHGRLPLSTAPAATVRVLRLTCPLIVEDAGAVRLVAILEWAERIARIWRAHGASGSEFLEFDELSMGTPDDRPKTTVGSPFGSSTTLGKLSTKSTSRLRSPAFLRSRRESKLSISASSMSSSSGSLPPVDPTQRPFDAIINYVLDGIPEKQALKQTILVTSLTRPFLASSMSPYYRLSDKGKSKRKSVLYQPSLYSLPPTPPYQSGESLHPETSSLSGISSASVFANATPSGHMIHILPSNCRPHLIQSLDSFLSSFSVSNISDDIDHAKQFMMHGSTLSDIVGHSQEPDPAEWMVLELILHASLDNIMGKAWIGSGQDILLLPPGGGGSSFNSISSLSSVSKHASSKPNPHVTRSTSENQYLAGGRTHLTVPGAGTVAYSSRKMEKSPETSPPALRLRTNSESSPSPHLRKPQLSPTLQRPTSEYSTPSGGRNHTVGGHEHLSQPYSEPLAPSRRGNVGYPTSRLSISPELPPKDAVRKASPVSPTRSTTIPIPSADVSQKHSSKVMRRSKLGMVVSVEEAALFTQPRAQPQHPLPPTPPESDDSNYGDRRVLGKVNPSASESNLTRRKSKWKFWKNH